ncbi:MAG TPA: helix-turn-helix domain-containing protein [Sulfurovum sp.]
MSNINKLYSIKSTSENTGISIPMLKKLIYSGVLTYTKIGAKIYIDTKTIQDYITENRVEARQ